MKASVFVKAALGTILLFVVLFLLILNRSDWAGKSRYRLVLGNKAGEVHYLLFDPKRSQILAYSLDTKIEVDAAFKLGDWKIESLWKLGEQEKKGGGTMLSKSLIRGYALPVEGFISYSGEIHSFPLVRALVFTQNTDISLGDRLSLAWFVMGAKISDEGMLKTSSIILTGEELEKLSNGIVTIAAPGDFLDTDFKRLSNVIANLGGKVLDTTTTEDKMQDLCKVTGKGIFSVKLAKILKCSFVSSEAEGIRLILSDEFVKTF